MRKTVLGILFLFATHLMAQSPTVVLVHGALFTSQGWFLVQNHLQNAGTSVITMDVPGRAGDETRPKEINLATATSKLCKIIRSHGEPVTLVGHSQGGAIITQALEDCGDKVKALIYVAAVVPLNGETAFDGLDPKRDVNFSKCVTVDAEAGLFRLNRKGPLEVSFFADLRRRDEHLVNAALATMVSEPMGVGTTPLRYKTEKFAAIPKYYVEATEDQVVSVETQRKYQERTPFSEVFSLKTSHCPFLTMPKELARILLQIQKDLP